MSEPVQADAHDLASFGYKQELNRSLGSFSSFAAGFSYISILTGMFQTAALGFLFAGRAFIWAWPIVFLGQMTVALQFAELAAHYPLAGSVYQWSKRLAGKPWAWNTGWIYLCAQIVTIPAVALAWQVILPQISHKFQIVDCTAGAGGRPARKNCGFQDPAFAKNAFILGAVMIVLTTTVNLLGVRIISTDQQHRRDRRADRRRRPDHPAGHQHQARPLGAVRDRRHGRRPRLGLLRRAAARRDHAALRDVRLRHGRLTGRGDRRSAAHRAEGHLARAADGRRPRLPADRLRHDGRRQGRPRPAGSRRSRRTCSATPGATSGWRTSRSRSSSAASPSRR